MFFVTMGFPTATTVEQLTYLLFLKMADEQTKSPFSREPIIPAGLDWPSLKAKDGDELEVATRDDPRPYRQPPTRGIKGW